jgi:hypothetical protein
MAPYRRVVDSVLKSALIVGDAFCATPEAHLLAEIVATFPADVALSARDADLKCNPIADRKALHLRANSHDNTGRLMTKREGTASVQVTIGKFLVI